MGKSSALCAQEGWGDNNNQQEEWIDPNETINRWRICMDYRKLKEVTRKDFYVVPFIDQKFDRFAG